MDIFNSCEFLFQTQHFGRVRVSVNRYQFLLKRKSQSLEGSAVETFVSGEGDLHFLKKKKCLRKPNTMVNVQNSTNVRY
jgi:hypothetical protein